MRLPSSAGRRAAARRRAAAAVGVTVTFTALLLVLWSYAAKESLLAKPRSSAAADVACYTLEDASNVATVAASAPRAGVLDDAAALRPSESSIFFVETTCGSGAAWAGVQLQWRQACAVESAALLHPHRTVYVLLMATAAPARNTSQWSPAARALLAYPNVRVAHVALTRYVRGTPLHALLVEDALASSSYPRSHASDVMRFLTLWRFGGTYLDLDVVILRPLDGLRNFVGAESAVHVAAGAIGFARDALGRRMAAECLRELRFDFRGDSWGHNGPGVITRVLQRLCDTKQVSEMTLERCAGFRILPPSAFYPVQWQEWRRYFKEQDAAVTMAAINSSFAIHVWNQKSAKENVSLTSQQPYAQVARQFCPRVAQSAGTYF